jgi:AcrR family transcriptional regulator
MAPMISPQLTKGPATRGRIVEAALRVASVEGIEGISLGRVAADVGMSKSGLFAHFESKEELQVDVLQAAVEKFAEVVVRPAFAAPRGEPRLRALLERWLEWERNESLPGGCIFQHAAMELDDHPGPARDALVASQRQWLATMARAVEIAKQEGHFRPDVDAEQFAFQIYGLVLGYHNMKRLMRDPDAGTRIHRAFDSVIAAARVAPRET